MKISTRYIASQTLLTSLLVLLVLVVIDVLFMFINELEDVGEGSYGVSEVVQFVVLSLPRHLYELVPLALLIGGLLGLGALANSSELVVLRAVGLSPLQLTGAALLAGLALGLCALLIAEFIAPPAERWARELRAHAKQGGAVQGQDGGFWARDGEHIVKVGLVLSDGALGDVTLYSLVPERAQLKAITQAKSAQYISGAGYWLLREVRQKLISPQRITSRTWPQLRWDSVIKPATVAVLATDPRALALRDLRGYIRYLQANQLDARPYQLAFWLKALTPLTNLALLLVALPFAFTGARTVGAGQRLLLGVVLGLGFFLLTRLLSNGVLLVGLPPWLGALLPPLLFTVGGAVALARLR